MIQRRRAGRMCMGVTAVCAAILGTAAFAADPAPALGTAASLEGMLPPRTDSTHDWFAGVEPLHRCGEPRLLPTCVPPAPCHPAFPADPFDLVGIHGGATCGPIYRGPCAPRTGTHDAGPLPRLHRVHDRMFDWFYAPRTPLHR